MRKVVVNAKTHDKRIVFSENLSITGHLLGIIGHFLSVILRVVQAGCHPVAIAQVVEHWQLKSEAPVQSRVAASFQNILLSLFTYTYIYNYTCTCTSGS